ncbi:MAG TPA: hypothetical protein DHV36_05455, partial [Desulfobacteraceae bacterium]|nr:hypothetical protein [Desulfobacteraceae bacterium]
FGMVVRSQSPLIILLCLVGFSLPGLAGLKKGGGKSASATDKCRLIILVYVYFLARACSLWRMLMQKIKSTA